MILTQIVAAVDPVKGHAFARAPDGSIRVLKQGDPLYNGETLIADPNAQVLLNPEDGGNPFFVNGPVQIAMAPNIPDDDAEISPEALAQFIESVRPRPNLDDLEAPAAGGGGGGSYHDFVRLERIVEEVDPLGFSYSAEGYGGQGPFNDNGFDFTLSAGNGGGGSAAEPPEAPEPPPVSPTPPTGAPDHFEVIEGSFTKIQGSVLDNDTGVGQLTVAKIVLSDGTVVDVPPEGYKFLTELNGIAVIYPDGHFEYAAPVRDHSDDIPDIDSFQYIVIDENGNL
ncbi:MAG: retention module-containing protein, partial [Azoarcus sp.]|nr:retention module-containing protein [Azoarcus sp.]